MTETESITAILDRADGATPQVGNAHPHTVGRQPEVRRTCALATVAWPVLPDGRLASAVPTSSGYIRELGQHSIIVELDQADRAGAFCLGVEVADGTRQFAGISEQQREACTTGVRITGSLQGIGEQILREESRMPQLDLDSFRYRLPFDESVYESWCDAGILKREVLDRVLACPKCDAVTTFRFACRQCGSGRLQHSMLAHHFACAFVAPLPEFERDDQLTCPNCRTPHLVAGTDFEYMPGENECGACGWTDRDLEQTGHCLNCDHRFPAHQAIEHELVGYDAQRLDVLALAADLG